MREPRVSALILAKNEAANLPACLASLGWAHEVIVVVDASSRDQTEAIARRRADRVLVRPFHDFASQRNAALTVASGDWVFAIDADERVPMALAAELRSTLGDPSNRFAGYRVPIRSILLNRPFRYSGTQDDKPLRLFRRDLGRWVGEVHETVQITGRVDTLSEHLQHRTIPDIRTFLRKLDSYTTLEARRLHREGETWSRADLSLRPLYTFARLYLGKLGYRDGPEGFVFCALSAVSVAVRQWKLRELHLADARASTSTIRGPHRPTLLAPANRRSG